MEPDRNHQCVMSLDEIRSALHAILPYFRLQWADDRTRLHVHYTGDVILERHWKQFARFTSLIGFPLDFSSSVYVGISVSPEGLVQALRSLSLGDQIA